MLQRIINSIGIYQESPTKTDYTKGRIAEIKKHYGLVPLEHESYPHFIERVKKIVYRKKEPRSNPRLKGKVILSENTKRVQDLTKKYLGIEEEPIDGLKIIDSPFSRSGGFTLPETDGSSIVCISHGTDNYDELVNDLAYGLEAIIRGYGNPKKVHRKLVTNLLNNRDHILLHEGIHAIDLNNKPELTALFYTEDGKAKKFTPSRIPFVRKFYNLKLVYPLAELETLAYKTAFDEFTIEAFKDVEQTLKRKSVTISGLEDILKDFKTRNSKFTERIIKRAYLGRYGYKGVIGTAFSMALPLILGNWFLGDEKPFWNYFNGTEHYFWNTFGTLMYLKVAERLTGFFLGIHPRQKVRRCRKIYDKLIEKYGGAGKAFYETLGMNFKDRKKLLKKN